jgi:hypothetical protein
MQIKSVVLGEDHDSQDESSNPGTLITLTLKVNQTVIAQRSKPVEDSIIASEQQITAESETLITKLIHSFNNLKVFDYRLDVKVAEKNQRRQLKLMKKQREDSLIVTSAATKQELQGYDIQGFDSVFAPTAETVDSDASCRNDEAQFLIIKRFEKLVLLKKIQRMKDLYKVTKRLQKLTNLQKIDAMKKWLTQRYVELAFEKDCTCNSSTAPSILIADENEQESN